MGAEARSVWHGGRLAQIEYVDGLGAMWSADASFGVLWRN